MPGVGFIRPAGGGAGGGGSVSVSVSDTTPTQGDTVTITATPSGVTPSNYLFFYYDSATGTIQFLADQASNTFEWDITNFGTVDVFAIADDVYSNLQEIVIAVDPDAEAWLTANSFVNDATIYNSTYGISGNDLYTALGDFFVALKSESGLYSKIHWAYLYFGSDANKAKLNLVNPADTDAAYRVTWSGGWVFNDEGRVSNGTNTYGNTHFNASTELSVNDGFYGIYKRTPPTGGSPSAEWGAIDTAISIGNFFISKTTVDRSFYSLGVTKQVDGISPYFLDGFQSINRNNNANLQQWRGNDFGLMDSDTAAWVSNPNFTEFVGARNNSGTAFLFLENNTEVAFEIRADGLTTSQWNALHDAVNNLMLSLGWNV